MRCRNILRSAAAGVLSAVMAAAPAAQAQTINPEELLEHTIDQISEAAEKLDMPAFEGNVTVTAADGMRDAIAEHYRSQEDMSWIKNAQILLQGCSNEKNGADLEATFAFNDTELYHLLVSYDRDGNTIYLVCPELKDEVVEFPIKNFTSDPYAWTRKKFTAQMIAEGMSLFQELSALISSISLESLQEEILKYYSALQSYVKVDTGITTVQAGSLTEEASTTSLSVSAEDMQAAIPEALKMLAQDPFLQQILESEFADHVFNLVMRSISGDVEFPKGTLWTLTRQFLVSASEKQYEKMSGITVSFSVDKKQRPVQLAARLEKSGMQAELFQINAVMDGGDHAFEVKVGPFLSKKIGIKSSGSNSVLIQGSLKDSYLREAVSMNLDGNVTQLFKIENLDMLAFKHVWLSGIFTLIWKDKEYSCDFFRDENGLRTMVFRVGDEEWFTLTAELKEVKETSLDELDLSEPFTVDSRTAFEEYMRDASAINMFEKLSGAGVPQEYVDMLTDGEAATESSRENTVEKE